MEASWGRWCGPSVVEVGGACWGCGPSVEVGGACWGVWS